jgi:hypothetical protein
MRNALCADIYRLMLSDKKYGLSVNLMATRVMPSLLPQTVNPSLNLDQFTNLLEVLQEMLDHIDRYSLPQPCHNNTEPLYNGGKLVFCKVWGFLVFLIGATI